MEILYCKTVEEQPATEKCISHPAQRRHLGTFRQPPRQLCAREMRYLYRVKGCFVARLCYAPGSWARPFIY